MTYMGDSFLDEMLVFDYQFKSDLFSCSNMKIDGFIDKNCFGNGVFNLSNCQDGIYFKIILFLNYTMHKGVSSFLSQPHFLNADKKFVDSVTGLEPDRDKHNFIIHYDPVRSP